VLLEWVDAQVDRLRNRRPPQLAGEPVVLHLEMALPVAVAELDLVLAVIVELVPRRFGALHAKVRQLVVPVQVDAEVLVAGLLAL
jgi:hypothetical protein